MKNKFNEEENRSIYRACNTIRSLITAYSAINGFRHPNQGLGNLALKAGKGSVINELVQKRDWDNLFQNQEWLNILDCAYNVNILQNGIYKEHLITLAKFFPDETNGYIFVEIL